MGFVRLESKSHRPEILAEVKLRPGGVPSLDLIVGLGGVSRSNLNFCCFKYFPSGSPLLHQTLMHPLKVYVFKTPIACRRSE